MKTPANIIDQVFSIVQNQTETDPNLNSAEPLIANSTGSAGIPYRPLALLIDNTPIAIIGLAGPEYTVKSTQFGLTITRRTLAHLPIQPVECSQPVNNYKKYLRYLRRQLQEAYFRHTLDQTQAERLTNEAWRKLTLPILEE